MSRSFLQSLGLHPLAAAGLVAADMMLFAGEAATEGIGIVITVPVGFALGVATALLQRSAYGDTWGAAAGKGLVLGVLTAIPTPLPSLVTATGGALGLARLLRAPQPPPER